MANKIKYGLSNCYYAPITYGANDAVSYGTPVKLPGAVSLSLTQEGETTPFYADNITYWMSTSNNGYTGSIEVALIPDSFKKDVLGEIEDKNGILIEKSDAVAKEFALLFQFEGDSKASKHAMYRCVASRPDVASQTKEASITPQTETVNISALPRLADHLVKGTCSDTSATQYASWFTAVYEPSEK